MFPISSPWCQDEIKENSDKDESRNLKEILSSKKMNHNAVVLFGSQKG